MGEGSSGSQWALRWALISHNLKLFLCFRYGMCQECCRNDEWSRTQFTQDSAGFFSVDKLVVMNGVVVHNENNWNNFEGSRK